MPHCIPQKKNQVTALNNVLQICKVDRHSEPIGRRDRPVCGLECSSSRGAIYKGTELHKLLDVGCVAGHIVRDLILKKHIVNIKISLHLSFILYLFRYVIQCTPGQVWHSHEFTVIVNISWTYREHKLNISLTYHTIPIENLCLVSDNYDKLLIW